MRTTNYPRLLYAFGLWCFFYFNLFSQGGCLQSVGVIYGSPGDNERAKSILPTPSQDGLYIIGYKNDSTLIARLKLNGEVVWSRTIDMLPGKADNVTTAILDDEDMIVGIGIGGSYSNGGTAFAFRFNPNNQNVLWSREYITNLDRTYAFAIVQKPGGNYVMACDPHTGYENDDELFEINKSTGAIIGGTDKKYDLGGSDASAEMIYYQNSIYATGRYTDGGPNDKMRNTIIKFDPADLSPVWIRLGHVASGGSARLYGKDLVIEQDQIYSIYLGDPVGSSTSDTKLFVQKTDLNGNLVWLKQYELPGNNDWAQQIISSDNGLIVLASENAAPSKIVLFKINYNGVLLWARHFNYPSPISSVAVDRGNNQMQEIAGKIYVSVSAINSNGTSDILVLRLELNGEPDMPCVNATSANVTSSIVSSPQFYSVNATKLTGTQTVKTNTTHTKSTPLLYRPECVRSDTITQIIEATICQGDNFEGYSTSGIFTNYFISIDGCDSTRILDLIVSPYVFASKYISICSGQTFGPYNQTGTYTDTLSGQQGSCDTVRTINLYIQPLVTTSVDEVICAGENFDGYTESGIYIDTLVSFLGCDSVRELHLEKLDAISIATIASACDETNIFHHPPGQYLDTLISSRGCDSIVLLTVDDLSLYIPNVFSPNEDGINDEFKLYSYPESTLDIKYFGIFDRFGNMAYETTEWPVLWKGDDRKGKQYQPAVFTYVLVYNCGGGNKVEHGDITLTK